MHSLKLCTAKKLHCIWYKLNVCLKIFLHAITTIVSRLEGIIYAGIILGILIADSILELFSNNEGYSILELFSNNEG